MKEPKQTHPSDIKRGDRVTRTNSTLEWKVTDIIEPCEKYPFTRYECQRMYGRNNAVVLFRASELILVDPKPERN